MKNPKQKLKNILLLVIVLFTFSCSKDVYDEINNPNERITIIILNEKQIKSNKKLSLKLSALNETKTAVIGRFVHDTIYNFVINTNHATHIISNSQETFTFEVLRVNPIPGIENLVLISQPNGTFNATLVKYNFDSNQLLSMDQSAVNRSNVLYTPIDFDYNTVLNSINSRCIYSINCEETWTESCGIPPNEGEVTGGSIITSCKWVMTTGACYGSCGENSNSYPEFITLPTTNTSGGNGANTSQLTPSQIQFFTGLNFNGKDTFNSLTQEVINSIYAYVNTNNAAIQINAVQQFLNNTNGMWLGEQSIQTQQSIFNYLITNGFSTTSKNKINQLINYLMLNPNVSWNDINESYFSPYPEIENFIDINPDNITYETPLTSQNLPSLASFKNNFPKNGTNGNYTQMSPSDVYNLVGGSLLNSYNNNPQYGNACTIRGSRGLLYSNIQIPVLNYSGSQRTQKGGDLKNYILDAKSFNKFMIDKFGDTTHKLEGAAANDPTQVMNLLSGKNGIYVIINNNSSPTNGAGYSGHVDLILNGNCIGNEYLGPKGGVKSIRIWTLN